MAQQGGGADTRDAQAEVIDFLHRPETLGAAEVERVETHIAIVFLAGGRAWKLKKAVRLPYVDFSTLERRHEACRRELALNRLSAPDLYLGLEPVRRLPSGGLALGGDAGEVLDWVVVMRRFDQDDLLDRRALAGRLDEATVLALADAVADLHARSAVVRQADPAGALKAILDETLAELEERADLFGASAVEGLERVAGEELARRARLLTRREEAGFVRRGHGDLHLRNIVLWRGRPTIFDALEFDDALATADTVYDLAFLLMDMEHRGLNGLACRLLARYLAATGDDGGVALLPLTLALRAMIRAKIAATVEATADNPEAAGPARDEARSYFALAAAELAPGPPVLVAVAGLSGSGKSRLAHGLAPFLGQSPGAVTLRSDEERKRLFGVPDTQRLPDHRYAPEVDARVRARLEERAATLLEAGHAVILDATHLDPAQREAAEALARSRGVPFLGLWLEAPPEVLRARVAQRTGDVSDAGLDVLERQLARDPGPVDWQRIGASGTPADTLAAALAACRDEGLRLRRMGAGL